MDRALEWAGIAALALVALRTVLQACADALGRLAVRLHAIDLRDGREDWGWTRHLSTAADVLSGVLEAVDSVLDVLPVRGLASRGQR